MWEYIYKFNAIDEFFTSFIASYTVGEKATDC